MPVELTIRGIQEAQQRNLERIAALQPGGTIEEAVRWGTIEAERYGVGITHVDTGTWRASHRIEFRERGLEGRVFVDPRSINPRGGARAAEYAAAWEERGGSMAVYKRTAAERGAFIAAEMGRMMMRGLG
jgi:hypothetical protein